MMQKRTKLGIRAKIALGYTLLLLCLGFTAFMLIQRMYAQQQEIHFIVDHDLEVHNLSNRMEKDMLDMETGQRGYIITGNQSYLEPYNNGKRAWTEDYIRLDQLITDNPSQVNNLEAIRATIERWIESFAEPTIAYKQSGQADTLRQTFEDDLGKRTVDQLRTQFDRFRNIEKNLTQKRVSELERHNEILQLELYLLMAAAVVVTALVIWFISGSIVTTVHQVTSAIQAIATPGSRHGARIRIASRDEIRDLAEATNLLLAGVEEQDWLKSTLAELGGLYQGQRSAQELGQVVLGKLTTVLNVPYAAFYLATGQPPAQTLIRLAAYAATGDLGSRNSFAIGEGLVGQAALEKRILQVNGLPGTYIKIASGLGESIPNQALLIPIYHEGQVQGVIELAAFHTFKPIHLDLLEQIRETLGTALHSVLGRTEIERLYHESQTLTEELQTQTEELQMQAEELQSQQEELIAANDTLKLSEERLQWQKLALEQQSEDMAALSRYKSEFLANMSHELRTPLNSMLILSEMLAQNKEGNLSGKQQEFAQTIHGSGTDLLRLINEILDLSKVEAGKMELDLERCSLFEIKDVLTRTFQPQAAKKGILFHVAIGADVPEFIETDVHRLQQILRNLLSNAFKFTAKGSVSLRIDKAPHTGYNGSGSVQSGIAFSVTDTGIGIPKDRLEQIFEAFHQVDGTISRKYGGTGLGLTISRELARLLGGTIHVESSEGVGSRFTLYVPEQLQGQAEAILPIKESAATRYAVSRADHAVSLKRLLIIERNDVLREMLMRLIRQEHIAIDVVNSTLDALDSLRSQTYDGIILDFDLADDRALYAFTGLEELPPAPIPPMIVYSGRPLSVKEETQLRRLGGKLTMKIAAAPDSLLKQINTFLDNRPPAPAAYPDQRWPVVTEHEQIESFQGKQVLLVEDDIRNVFALSTLLEKQGLKLLFAENGREALQQLEAHPDIDLVLMDIMMPEMDGFEAMKQIRNTPQFRELPIIALSAKAMKEDRLRCIEAGASDYLSKPVDTHKLISVLQVWLT